MKNWRQHGPHDIKPHSGGWKVSEGPGVEPFYDDRRAALDYARTGTTGRVGEIRIWDTANKIGATIPFDDSKRVR